jgi:hypothetical protein
MPLLLVAPVSDRQRLPREHRRHKAEKKLQKAPDAVGGRSMLVRHVKAPDLLLPQLLLLLLRMPVVGLLGLCNRQGRSLQIAADSATLFLELRRPRLRCRQVEQQPAQQQFRGTGTPTLLVPELLLRRRRSDWPIPLTTFMPVRPAVAEPQGREAPAIWLLPAGQRRDETVPRHHYFSTCPHCS